MSAEALGHVLPVMEDIGGCERGCGFSVEGGQEGRHKSLGEEMTDDKEGHF